jgi:hypothetical protein
MEKPTVNKAEKKLGKKPENGAWTKAKLRQSPLNPYFLEGKGNSGII